jgi:hypothetical protein
MAIINAYKYEPRPLSFEASAYRPFGNSAAEEAMYFHQYGVFLEGVGGYDPYSRAVTPMAFDRDVDCYFYLDSMTGAVEAGLIDSELWVSQLWQSPDDLDAFLAMLSDYDEFCRVVDRWWQMFSLLTGNADEEGMVTCHQLAEEMALAAAKQADALDAED